MARVQSAAIFTSSTSSGAFGAARRVGTAQNLTFTINPGDTQEVADSGVFNTDGVTLSEVQCDNILPVGGLGVSWFQAGIDHEDIDLVLGIIDGKLFTLKECRIRRIEVQSEKASGKLTARFEFQGGTPSMT